MNHLENEFEVQIRDGRVTNTSIEVLHRLSEDFALLQIEDQIDGIFAEKITSFKKQRRCLLQLLEPVKADLVDFFSKSVSKFQQKVKKKQRLRDNKMCQGKCKSGPTIHNFTDKEIPDELNSFLENGLGNVPEVDFEKEVIRTEIENEVKLASKNLFISLTGSYPSGISFKDSVDSFLKKLMILAPNNEKLTSSLISLRENYISYLPRFLKSVKKSGKCNIKRIQKLIPKDCILSPSDKGLGASLLPVKWYEKEYKAQILKGGYEVQKFSEEKCLAMLLRKISEFRISCTDEQNQS